MSKITRRTFVAAVAAAPVSVESLGNLFIAPDDRALLTALAEVVLPAERTPGTQRPVERFERWVSNYRPGAEVNHGYGTGRIERTPADPWPAWRAQLHSLEAQAQNQHERSFTEVSIADRTAIVTAQLDALGADRIPTVLTASHVALALLSWFLSTSEANDLCYRARIGKEYCRPLGTISARPALL